MNDSYRDNSDREIDLREYWRVLALHKRLILSVTAVAFLFSIVISLLLPKYYSSTASVMPPQNDNMLSADLMSRFSGSGSLVGSFLGTKTPADLWVGILKSRSVSDMIIEKFKLRELYGTDTIEDTREQLQKYVSVKKSKEEIVTVTVEDRVPERAARMANAFIEELDRVNRSAVMTSGQKTRVFLEKRLYDAKKELAGIGGSLRSFQERNKAIKLDDQAKAIIDAIGTVKGQLMAKEVELSTLLSYATPANPNVELLSSEIDGLKNKLSELERGKGTGGGVRKDIFIPTDRIPDLTLQYARMMRDAKVQETLFELLTQQYEMARIQEAKDSPTVQVLDTAMIPEKKIKPKRRIIVMFLTSVGLFSSLILSFVLEYIKRSKGTEA